MITVLAFIFTLGILVVVHEFAHYRVAVACGVKVERFSIGFGRVVWRRQARPGGTEFVLSALPLGGYVKWIDDRESPPISAEEQPMMFSSRPLWQRAAIVAAGPVSNLLLAVFLYAAASWIGVDEPRALLSTPSVGSLAERAGLHGGDLVTAVGVPDSTEADPVWSDVRSMSDLQWEMTQAILAGRRLYLRVDDADGHGPRTTVLDLDRIDAREMESGGSSLGQRIGVGMPFSAAVLGAVTPDGPAARAGLRAGDRVLRLNGHPVADGAALREMIRTDVSGDSAAVQTWSIERGGRPQDIDVQPRVMTDGAARIARIDAVIGAAPQMVMVRRGPVEGLVLGARRTWEVSSMTVTMFGRMITGQASLRNLSGPITIAQVAGDAVRHGLAYYLGILALISVSLGVLNLLPLPMLDGGHLMYYIFEAATGRPVAGQWLRWLQGGGALLMLLLTSLALYNDVARLMGLPLIPLSDALC